MNPLRTCTVVMAHQEAQQTFDHHLPYWQRSGTLNFVHFPIDSQVRTDLPRLVIGKKGHHGAASIQRFKQLMFVLSGMDFDRFTVHEYDSLCLDTELPNLDNGRLWANVWKNTEPERFKGSHYFHPPLMIPKRVLSKLVVAMMHIPDNSEGSCWDRVLGLAVDRSDVPFASYEHFGFSRNTIEREHIPAAVAARKAGASLFHGVKSLEVLRLLTCA